MSKQKNKIKILLVDEAQDFINALSHRIEIRKLYSDVAYNIEQAFQIIKYQVPDVILIEPKMKSIGGFRVLQNLKRNHPHTEIIVLTDHITTQDKIEVEKLGAFACFQKSIDVDDLINSIRSAAAKKMNLL
jgi:DNA-binding NtrC family response regulator